MYNWWTFFKNPFAIQAKLAPRDLSSPGCLYCCTLSTIFFLIQSVEISRWHGFKSLHERPTFTFWSTLSWARAPDSATCAGRVHGRDYSLYWLRAKAIKGLAIIFPWTVENTWNTMAHSEGFSTLTHRLEQVINRKVRIENLKFRTDPQDVEIVGQ